MPKYINPYNSEAKKQLNYNRKDPPITLKLASWSVDGNVEDAAKRNEIDKVLVENGVDIACVQDTQLSNDSLETKNYKWHIIGKTTKDSIIQEGIAILARKEISSFVMNINAITDNILACNVKMNRESILVVSAHISNDDDGDEFKFLEQYLSLNNKKSTIVLGNFNAEIGEQDITANYEEYFGDNLLHKVSNGNGKMLKNMVKKANYNVKNTWSNTSRSLKATCVAADGRESQVDHILTSGGGKILTKSITCRQVENVKTTHKLILCEINILNAQKPPQKRPAPVSAIDRESRSYRPDQQKEQKVARTIIDITEDEVLNPNVFDDVRIEPGEPVPPGFEDEIKQVAELNILLSKCKKEPLIGLEYIIEMSLGKGSDHAYYCVLCNHNANSKHDIMNHLLLYDHRLNYLRKHFPTVYESLHAYLFYDNSIQVLSKYIDKIGFAIEDEYGRLQPAVVEMEEFFCNRDNYVNRIEQKEVHFVERNVSRLLDIIDHKEIQKALEQESRKKKATSIPLHPPPGDCIAYEEFNMEDSSQNFDNSSVNYMTANDGITKEEPERKTTYTERRAARQARRFTEFIDRKSKQKSERSAEHKRSKDRRPDRRRSPDRRHSPFRNHSRDRYRSPSREHKHFQPCDSDTDRRYNNSQSNQDINVIYRNMVDDMLKQQNKLLTKYETDPESYPLYPVEWNEFWKNRCTELESENINPYSYDFTSEWTEFWLRRVKEIHDNNVERKISEIKTILNLPSDYDRIENERHISRSRSIDRLSEPNSSNSARSIIPKASDHKIIRPHIKPQRARTPEKRVERIRTSTSIDRSNSTSTDVPKPKFDIKDIQTKLSSTYTSSNKFEIYQEKVKRRDAQKALRKTFVFCSDEDSDEDYNYDLHMIGVLRILSAFELHLGSLGTKIIDLLSKAVALEKVKPNLADDMLMNEENSVLLETTKEKLKGLCHSNMFNANKYYAIKRALHNINKVVKIIDEKTKLKKLAAEKEANIIEKKKELQKTDTEKEPSAAAKPAPVSRMDIMKQIETSLMLQGKQVTPPQLEEFTNIYMQNRGPKDTPYLFGIKIGEQLASSNSASKLSQIHSINNTSSSFGRSQNYASDDFGNFSENTSVTGHVGNYSENIGVAGKFGSKKEGPGSIGAANVGNFDFGGNSESFRGNIDNFGRNIGNFEGNRDNFGTSDNNYGGNLSNFGRNSSNFGSNQGNYSGDSGSFGETDGNYDANSSYYRRNSSVNSGNYSGGHFGGNHGNFVGNSGHFGESSGNFGRRMGNYSGNSSNFAGDGDNFSGSIGSNYRAQSNIIGRKTDINVGGNMKGQIMSGNSDARNVGHPNMNFIRSVANNPLNLQQSQMGGINNFFGQQKSKEQQQQQQQQQQKPAQGFKGMQMSLFPPNAPSQSNMPQRNKNWQRGLNINLTGPNSKQQRKQQPNKRGAFNQ